MVTTNLNGHKDTVVSILPAEFYKRFISKKSASRKPSPIRDLFPVELKPGMISMLAGKPNPTMFPFRSVSMTIKSFDAAAEDTVITIDGELLDQGLQYGPVAGLPPLVNWVTNLMTHSHGREVQEGWAITMGPGSQDLLYKAFHALVDEGDSILVEAPTYSGIIPIILSLNCNIVEVPIDGEGIVPSAMEDILASWPSDKPFPKLLYTVPYGGNPTGTTIPTSRRKTILDMARRYDFLILEDDPYFHLYYGLKSRPISYFALEKLMGGSVGRVLRFDSFSKILASGLRLGWTTGPLPLIHAIDLHSGCSSLQPCSMSQVMALSLLRQWGMTGFLAHTDRVSEFYKNRRDVCEKLLQRHLGGKATWTSPVSGMFFWVKLLLPLSIDDEGEGDSTHLIRTRAVEKCVLVLPGTASFHDERMTPYIRLSFSIPDDDEMDEALRRLAAAIHEAEQEVHVNGHVNGNAHDHVHSNAYVNSRVNGVKGLVNGVKGHANGVNGHVNGVNGRVNGVNGRVNGVNGHVIRANGHINGKI